MYLHVNTLITSKEFCSFIATLGFTHMTSSPCYPQSNGKAENVVKTVKRLFKKCCESGQFEPLALLDWCNTPSVRALDQGFLGWQYKMLLPMAVSKLQPAFSTSKEAQVQQRGRQQIYFNQHAKELKPIQRGKQYE